MMIFFTALLIAVSNSSSFNACTLKCKRPRQLMEENRLVPIDGVVPIDSDSDDDFCSHCQVQPKISSKMLNQKRANLIEKLQQWKACATHTSYPATITHDETSQGVPMHFHGKAYPLGDDIFALESPGFVTFIISKQLLSPKNSIHAK